MLSGQNDHFQRQTKLSAKILDLYRNIESTDAKLARSRVREYNTQSEFQFFSDDSKPITDSLADEFYIFKTLFKGEDNFSICSKPCAYLRYCAAVFLAVIGLPSILLLIPMALMFLLYSWFYPVVELVIALVETDLDLASIPPLPLCLTMAYLFIILLMICLAPRIYNFNRLCTDIVPLNSSGLPPCFYDVAVVERINVVYESELCWQFLVSLTS